MASCDDPTGDRPTGDGEERFESLLRLSSDLYWELDVDFKHTFLCGTNQEVTRDALGKLQNDPQWHYVPDKGTWDDWYQQLATQPRVRDFVIYQANEGEPNRWWALSGEPRYDEQGTHVGYRGVSKHITEQKLGEQRVEFLATHDALTGLANRTGFSSELQRAIANSRRYDQHFTVLFIDLDRFKIINDTLGHDVGDQLLTEIAQRLKLTLRAGDLVARLGGDEFVVLMPYIKTEDVAAQAQRILDTVVMPMVLVNQPCHVTASIGICSFPQDADDERNLMKRADLAMYRAKEEGKNNYQFYSEDIKSQSLERLAFETSLRRALERREFVLHFQPQLDLRGNTIAGVEALLRWQHPELGLVAPGQFIALAEETGLIVPIGKWVLQEACRQNAAWQQEGLPPVLMSVNVSPRQFADEQLVPSIIEALEDAGLPAKWLEVEVTESMLMSDLHHGVDKLSAIKALGVRVAIDDFGVGYSSLGHLRKFPVDTLKVDRSFVRDLPGNHSDQGVTRAIIEMAKSLKLAVVAEGVETLEQEAFLRTLDCDKTQGFLFSKPVAAPAMQGLLRGAMPVQHRDPKGHG